MSLLEIQSFMQDFIKNPEIISDEIFSKVEGTTSEDKHKRLSIYANAYLLRICGCMKKDFSSLYSHMEDEEFNSLIANYLQKYPSHTYNIGEVGIHLSSYLRETPEYASKTFLAELAEFDFKKMECFYAPVPKELKHEHLNSLDPTLIPTSKVTLNPSLQFIESGWGFLGDSLTPLQGRGFYCHVRQMNGDIKSTLFTAFEHQLILELSNSSIESVTARLSDDFPEDFDTNEFFQRLILVEIIWDIS